MKKILAIALTTALTAMSANAQECCNTGCNGFVPSWFVQFQGGVNLGYTPGDHGNLLAPSFALNVGRNINPLVSARLGIEGCQSKAYNAYNADQKNTFKYATGSFDAMLNVTNIWTEHYCHPLNFYILGGVGCNWSGMETTNSSHFSPNIRLGAQLDWRVAENVALNLEYRAENTNDQFNGRLENGTHDWYSNMMLGVSLVFPDRAKVKVIDNQAKIDSLNDQINKLRSENEALKNRKPEVVVKKEIVKDEPLKETVYFQINASDPANDPALDKVVAWCNKYPEKSVVVKGYADKGTGTAKINKRISQKRAAKVVEALKAKGISADRIGSTALGDTVQPYPQNDDNRCTIVVGE